MLKISKEMRLTLIVVGIIAIIAYFMSSGSDAPPTPHKNHKNFGTASSQIDDTSGIMPEDLTAHFPRYPGGSRNPFIPAVVSGSALAAGNKTTSSWALTGINSIDGVTTALVENGATGDSVFLKVGDHWNGLHVVSIGSQSATFVDPNGKVTQLSFPLVAPDTTENGSPSAQAPQQNSPFPVSGTVPTGGIPPFPVTNVAPLNSAP